MDEVEWFYDELAEAQVDLVLELGESFSDEAHTDFINKASDIKDEAMEFAEKSKESRLEEAFEGKAAMTEDREKHAPGLMTKKDREEFYDEKLEISVKDSQEEDSTGPLQMELIQRNFQKQIPDKTADLTKKYQEDAYAQGAPDIAVKIHREVEATADDEFYDPGEKLFGSMSKAPDIVVKIHREVEAIVADEFHDPGEKLFGNMPQSEGLTGFNITFNDREPARFKLSGPVWVKRRSGSIRLNTKTAMAGQLGYDNGKPAQYDVGGTKYTTQQESDTFDVEQQFGVLQQARVRAKFKTPGLTYVKKSVEDFSFGITYNPGEKLFIDMAQFKGFTRLNILFKHMDGRFKLEQQFGGLKHARDFAKLKLSDPAYVKRCAGSSMFIVKYEFIKKGIEHGNLLEQPVFIARSSKDSGSVIKDSRLKEKYKMHGYDLKQPGRLDILERDSCMERLFKDVSRVEEPDGLKLNKNYACTKKYRVHEQIYDDKYREVEHGLCISLRVVEIISKDFSEFKSVANLQRASGIPELYENIHAPYDRFDPCSTSSYINLTGNREWVEEVLGNINGAGQLGTVPQSSGEMGVGLVTNS